MMSLSALDRLRVLPATLALHVLFILLLLPPSWGIHIEEETKLASRKLVDSGSERWPERTGEECSKDSVAVYQGDTPPLPSGIPTYTVQILNECPSGCSIADIHVSCGWFSSARQINPKVFRRLGFDDCLVNDGAAIPAGGSLSFQYANTFRYPLAVSTVSCA